jgi:predicted membrane-bound mannosyltransferase
MTDERMMKAALATIDQKNTVEAVEAPQSGVVLTAEAALYTAILGMAALLRLWNLTASPLSAREAAQAIAAFNGTPLPAGGSPLLFGINQALFGLFGTTVNDAGVRLVAAVIGTIMVLLPFLFRSAIGRYGALAAALMLAISPTMVAPLDRSMGRSSWRLVPWPRSVLGCAISLRRSGPI